jgi:hypothetical protein
MVGNMNYDLNQNIVSHVPRRNQMNSRILTFYINMPGGTCPRLLSSKRNLKLAKLTLEHLAECEGDG